MVRSTIGESEPGATVSMPSVPRRSTTLAAPPPVVVTTATRGAPPPCPPFSPPPAPPPPRPRPRGPRGGRAREPPAQLRAPELVGPPRLARRVRRPRPRREPG